MIIPVRAYFYAAALVLFAGGYAYMHHHIFKQGEASGNAKVVAFKAGYAQALAAHDAKAAVITERVVTQYVDRVKVIREKGKTIIQQVPVYVSHETDLAYPVPVGFVSLHNAAAQGAELPATAGSTYGAPSGIAISAVARTVATNYETCHETGARLIALQSWVLQQSKTGTP